MQYRTMPCSDEKLSVLGFGCMRLPTRFGGPTSAFIDKNKAVKQIRYAIDNGVNYLDTAWPYHMGHSESFLGEHVLTDGYREKVNIATKLPCFSINTKEAIEKTFNKQLDKLNTDVIDYYLLHSLAGGSWDKMLSLGVIEFMDRIRKEGKVRKMGFSFHGKKSDFIKIVDGYNWDFAQVQFNILDESFQAGIEGIEYAHSKNLGIIVMEPLRGGALVGKMPSEIHSLYRATDVKRSPVDWALRWILNHPAVTMILSGMNNLEHVKENIRVTEDALPGSMTAQETEIIRSVRNTYNRLLQVRCTGCAYCLPCPVGIDIPAAFKNLNNYHMFSKIEAKIFHAAYLGIQTDDGKAHWTSSCINCGACEAKCPQSIPIRSHFPQIQKELEGPLTKTVAAIGRKLVIKKTKKEGKVD